MYQALYRKWRPRVFEDVVGQPHIIAALRGEVTAGRVGHAYLFTGSRGTGKTTCAKILAKAVNCLNPHDGDPCNECESCRGIDNGTLLDVVEIDAASNNGVDNIRDLREEAVFTPASAKYRVYIIDEAHMLSTGAFNALLKTLEEPPAHVIFILATTEVHKILPTILSRCQRFDFRRIPPEAIVGRLAYIAGEEKLELEPEAAGLIARLADGGMRDALSLLDQCIGVGSDAKIDTEVVTAAAGLAGREYLFEISAAVASGDAAAALSILDRLYSASKDVERLCEEMLQHFRNLLLVKTVKEPFGVIRCTAAEGQSLVESAAAFKAETLLYVLDTLQVAMDALRRSASRRIEMEMCLLRLCKPELNTSSAALLRRIARLEDALAGGATLPRSVQTQQTAEAENPAREEQEIRSSVPQRPARAAAELQSDPGVEQAAQPESQPLDCWPEILDSLAEGDAPLRGVLNASTAVVQGGHVLIDASNSMFKDLIRQQSHQKALITSVRKVTGKPYKVGILKKSLAAPKLENDPLDELVKNAGELGIKINEK